MGQVLPTWNRSVLDLRVKRAIEGADGSRPVIPHSGVLPHPPKLDGTDSHLYFGWYWGDERNLPGFAATVPRMVRFVSEFGAQAVPESAEFMEPERWPDLDWSRSGAPPRAAEVGLRRPHPAARLRDVRGVARGHAGVPGHAGATSRGGAPSPQVPARGRLRRVPAQRLPAGGQLEPPRPRPGGQGRLPRPDRGLPAGHRRGRPPARGRCSRATPSASTCTSSATSGASSTTPR